MAAGRVEGVTIYIGLFEFEVEVVLWVMVLLVEVMVLLVEVMVLLVEVMVLLVEVVVVLSERIMCLSVRVLSVTSIRCEASLLHRASKYVTTACREENDTLYI
jgi:type IV secretory pathway VirB3-like protein